VARGATAYEGWPVPAPKEAAFPRASLAARKVLGVIREREDNPATRRTTMKDPKNVYATTDARSAAIMALSEEELMAVVGGEAGSEGGCGNGGLEAAGGGGGPGPGDTGGAQPNNCAGTCSHGCQGAMW
jgi:hypothetical protein